MPSIRGERGEPKSTLFGLETDVGEQNDVLAEHSGVADRLRSYLKAFENDLLKNSRSARSVKNPKPLAMH